MITSDQVPPGTDWISRRLSDLERQMRELMAGRRLESASLGAGGLTVKGGSVSIVDTQGAEIIRLGTVRDIDGEEVPGMVVHRGAEGPTPWRTRALGLYNGLPAIWDRTGNIVLATDEVSGEGLARPWLPVTWAGSDYTQWPGTTLATFAPLVETLLVKQQSKMFVRVRHTADSSGTTGELRLMCNGSQLGTTVSVSFAVNTTDLTVALPEDFSDVLGLSIEGRRTAGTGAVRAMVTASWTRQS